MKLFNNPIHVSLLVAIVVCVSTWVTLPQFLYQFLC